MSEMQQEQVNSSSSSQNSNLIKRKIADTFYNPSLMETQHFSTNSEIISIQKQKQQQQEMNARNLTNHSYTNSLPLDTKSCQLIAPGLSLTNSASNLYEKSNYIYAQQQQQQHQQQLTLQQQQQQQSCSTVNANHLIGPYMNSSALANNDFHTNGSSQHVKTYSLPTSLDAQSNYANNLPPRIINTNGDIPLPPGN
jgi:hypothetical protein